MAEPKEMQEQIFEKVDSMQKQLSELHTAVVGNPDYGHEGLVRKVDRHDRYINRDKKIKWTIAGGASVLFMLWKIFFS